jgi:TRAP-type mannitol/chloroaromatic compound transport system permease small subunit
MNEYMTIDLFDLDRFYQFFNESAQDNAHVFVLICFFFPALMICVCIGMSKFDRTYTPSVLNCLLF